MTPLTSRTTQCSTVYLVTFLFLTFFLTHPFIHCVNQRLTSCFIMPSISHLEIDPKCFKTEEILLFWHYFSCAICCDKTAALSSQQRLNHCFLCMPETKLLLDRNETAAFTRPPLYAEQCFQNCYLTKMKLPLYYSQSLVTCGGHKFDSSRGIQIYKINGLLMKSNPRLTLLKLTVFVRSKQCPMLPLVNFLPFCQF